MHKPKDGKLNRLRHSYSPSITFPPPTTYHSPPNQIPQSNPLYRPHTPHPIHLHQLPQNAFLVVLFVMGTAAEVATGRGLADPRYELFVPVPGAPPVAITQHHVLIAVVAWLVEASGMCKKADVTAQGEGERGNREWALGRVRALTGP